jgi:methylthioribose-1-phosphate isomerase
MRTGEEDRVLPSVAWEDDAVVMIDQRLLPAQEVYLRFRTPEEIAGAIRDMVVRGAPAIGVAAAMGCARWALSSAAEGEAFEAEFRRTCALLAASRPTAVNLFWAIGRMERCFAAHLPRGRDAVGRALREEALAIEAEDLAACRAMGDLGAGLLPENVVLLTHCNAGALATAGYGTALGVIRSAARMGKVAGVFADETRPYLQGARLTAWELMREGIPTTLIADNMAGHLMSRGQIHAVVVGADRIARNGDVANKIGTYTVAVLAKENGVPFYVAAPRSTLDPGMASGEGVPIEERSPDEVTHHGGKRLAPAGVKVRNPVFDITPARYVTAIVTEAGIARPPYEQSLASLLRGGS